MPGQKTRFDEVPLLATLVWWQRHQGGADHIINLCMIVILVTMKLVFPWFLVFAADADDSDRSGISLALVNQCEIYPENKDIWHCIFAAMFSFLILLTSLPDILHDIYWLCIYYYTRDVDFVECHNVEDGEWKALFPFEVFLYFASLCLDLVSGGIFVFASLKLMFCASYLQMTMNYVALSILVDIDEFLLYYWKWKFKSDDAYDETVTITVHDVCDKEEAEYVEDKAYSFTQRLYKMLVVVFIVFNIAAAVFHLHMKVDPDMDSL